MTLKEFKDKLQEYKTNNMSAFMGKIQITQMERDDLLQMYGQLAGNDRSEAAKLLKKEGIDAPK